MQWTDRSTEQQKQISYLYIFGILFQADTFSSLPENQWEGKLAKYQIFPKTYWILMTFQEHFHNLLKQV